MSKFVLIHGIVNNDAASAVVDCTVNIQEAEGIISWYESDVTFGKGQTSEILEMIPQVISIIFF